ncbi:uncharacterized protein LOC112976597 isoform X4 [Apteryx rowi]|uniref:uncharacterized protein LOC112976597 isoform X4 n=1 Tax=Apteryx rowi TaxID=308060 RepID=UPI000E1DBA8F|nr:uncharacterized protein LOC112976597 isoform X4 [Apteryx rowi]
MSGRAARRRRLVLHVDLNNTVVAADAVSGQGPRAALNSFLSTVTWGAAGPAGEWQWVSDHPSLGPPCPGAVSYYCRTRRTSTTTSSCPPSSASWTPCTVRGGRLPLSAEPLARTCLVFSMLCTMPWRGSTPSSLACGMWRWARNQFSSQGGKPLWIDPHDPSVHHIFFDDNIRLDDTDTIVHPQVFSEQGSSSPRCAPTSELYDICLVQTHLLEAIADENYFLRCVQRCEENYDRYLACTENGSPSQLWDGQ